MPIFAMGEPIGPMLNGRTYIVRPAMQPSNRPRKVARISAGGAQLFVGPASSLSFEQMNVPASTIIWHSRSYSSWLPSTQTTSAGWHSAAISLTQPRSLLLVVGLFTVAFINSPSQDFAQYIIAAECNRTFFTPAGLPNPAGVQGIFPACKPSARLNPVRQ